MKISTGLLISMVVFTVAGVLQGLACLRFINRVSGDRGVVIFLFVVLVFYAVTAAYSYSRWIKEKGKEAGACSEKR